MTDLVYQAKIGDGFIKKGLNRKNSFFSTPKEAISEAFALKERIDQKYEFGIEWDYDGKLTGSTEKVKFLKGSLKGDQSSEPFYLQIVTVDNQNDEISPVSPKKPKKVTAKDKKIQSKVMEVLN